MRTLSFVELVLRYTMPLTPPETRDNINPSSLKLLYLNERSQVNSRYPDHNRVDGSTGNGVVSRIGKEKECIRYIIK
jgi:hypothetical protein